MAKEIIDKVLDIERACEKSIEDAKLKAESIKAEAKTSSKNYYEQKVREARDLYEKKIGEAKAKAKAVIEEVSKTAELEKNKLLDQIKGKQDKAIKEVIDSLV